MMARKGIDTSHWNHLHDGPIDWKKVRAAGVTWAAIKLTEGSAFVDPWAEHDVHGAMAAGIETLGYHFARPHDSSADVQADHLLREVYKLKGVAATVLDVEDGRQMGAERLSAWVNRFIARRACQIVYYPESYERLLRGRLNLKDIGQWIAAPSASRPPAGSIVWQRRQAAVPGIDTAVDINEVFYEAGQVHG